MQYNEFAFVDGPMLCGSCGFRLMVHNSYTIPYVYQVYCLNRECPAYLHIMDVGDTHKVPLADTGTKAPSP